MKILLTGANGFVGIETYRQLIAEGHNVLAADSLRYGDWRIEADAATGSDLRKIDLRDATATADMVTGFAPDAIIHLAAIHFIPECEKMPGETISTNVEATVNLLSSCPTTCRFVFASTAAVYAPSLTPHLETSLIGPMDIYGHSKLAGENMVQYYAQKSGFSSVILRMFNVVGPGETNPHVIPEIMQQLKHGTRVLQLGNVAPKRDYIYVGDAAAAFRTAAIADFTPDENQVIANLGTGTSYSVAEIVERIAGVIGESIIIETNLERVRASDRPNLCADNSKMQRTFGWQKSHDITQSLAATWADYVA